MPFGNKCEFMDLKACIAANKDKDDPAAFCATLMRETEEHCAKKMRVADSIIRTKFIRPEIKVLDEKEGLVSAVVSTETADRDGDIIRQAGWELDRFMKHPALLSSHDYRSLRSYIGEWKDMKVTGKRHPQLEGVAQYYKGEGNEEADWGWNLAKKGQATYSVGFIPDMTLAVPIEGSKGMMGNFEFIKQELLEVSHVTIPSNPDALQRMKGVNPVIDEVVEEIMRDGAAKATSIEKLALTKQDMADLHDKMDAMMKKMDRMMDMMRGMSDMKRTEEIRGIIEQTITEIVEEEIHAH